MATETLPRRRRWRRTTRCRCSASTTSSSTSATRRQAAYWFTHALGFRETAYAGLETGVRDRASHVLEQGRVRFVLTAPLLGTSEIARHVGRPRRRRQGDRALGARRRARLPLRGPARRPRGPRAVGGVRRATARCSWRRSPPTARRCTRSSSATATTGPSCPASRRRRATSGRARRAVRRHRPRRRQRRARPHRRVGRLLRARLRDDRDDPLHRRATSAPSTRR